LDPSREYEYVDLTALDQWVDEARNFTCVVN
jgi:hypothetical protein